MGNLFTEILVVWLQGFLRILKEFIWEERDINVFFKMSDLSFAH